MASFEKKKLKKKKKKKKKKTLKNQAIYKAPFEFKSCISQHNSKYALSERTNL
jgi:hypothetical protein